MKKLFLIGTTALFFAACNSDSKSDMETKKEIVPDSAAQYKNSANTDTAKIAPVLPVAPVTAKPEVVKTKTVKKRTVNSTPASGTSTQTTSTTSSTTTTPTTSSTTTVPA